MFELLYNFDQDAYHLQNSDDLGAIKDGENGWELIHTDPIRMVLEEKADELQNARNDR